MEISWNETLTLQLISSVQKVEDDWGIREWEDQEEMWSLVAEELPLNFPGTLGVDLQGISDLCKARFLMLCRCFNDVFIKYTRHNCLTFKVMTALAGYSLRSDCHAFFREIGPREHFRAIVSVGVERSDIEYCASRGLGCGGLAASGSEDSKDSQKRGTLVKVIQEDFTESQERGSILSELIEDSTESLDFRATPKSEEENNSSFSGFVGVPRVYGLKYMPRCHTTFLTFIRNNKKYLIKYLPHKFSLSAGWINFARANRVKENDILVFRRLDFSTYQVIILGRECGKETFHDPGLHLNGRRYMD